MVWEIKISQEALMDLDYAVTWYKKIRFGLADNFFMNFEIVKQRISENPYLYAIKFNENRFVSLQRFPYVVVYKVKNGYVKITGVLHQKRNPEVIQKIISKRK